MLSFDVDVIICVWMVWYILMHSHEISNCSVRRTVSVYFGGVTHENVKSDAPAAAAAVAPAAAASLSAALNIAAPCLWQ